jgi:hypothetical protein
MQKLGRPIFDFNINFVQRPVGYIINWSNAEVGIMFLNMAAMI